jgi:hypothetical protein
MSSTTVPKTARSQQWRSSTSVRPGWRSTLTAALDDVALGPPVQYRGGGYWEAMHGAMTGWFEVRGTGPGREQFRLFCLLENVDEAEMAARGLDRPAIAVITGLRKPFRTTFTDADYAAVRNLGDDHKAQRPRRIAEPDAAERQVVSVTCTDAEVIVTTGAGTAYRRPLFGRLLTATAEERAYYTCSGDQQVIYWPLVNERSRIDDFFG